MAYADKEYQAKYHREVWYPKNRARRLELNKAWQKKQKDLYTEYKSTLSCQICGEAENCCLDFHHLDDHTKDGNVSTLARGHRKFSSVLKEIEKCVVLCSNCHRKVHAGVAQL